MSLPDSQTAASDPRQRESINMNWRFTKDDPAGTGNELAYANIKNWMMATGENLAVDADAPRHARPQGNIGQDVAYTQADFNDSQWRQLNLPHDWGIEGPFDIRASGDRGKLPFFGIGWYRKHINIPASDMGKQFYLDLDGAMSYTNVWCNGQYAGGWGYGYASFRIDLTPYIKPGQDNVLAIRLDNPDDSSRWYPGGGIYRNVWLTKTAPVHVGQWGTYLTTPDVSTAKATVALKVAVDNSSKADSSVNIKTQIFTLDADDRKIGSAVASTDAVSINVPAGSSSTADTQATINNPKLWSIPTPNRYVAVTSIEQDGKVVDSYETPFGIRSIKFDANTGFSINGQTFKLNGVCDHHDLGALGSAINYRALQRQIELLKEMGCNAIRTSHNPPAPELLELCDKMGLVVMDETFDCWLRGKRPNDYHLLFNEWSEKDTRMLLRRDRNHPCVVLWSIGNEINEQGSGEAGAAMAARLARFVHEEDPTRPTTSACNNAQPGSPFLREIDAIGLNYQGSRPSPQAPDGNYKPAHDAMPNKFIYGSETASTISSRGEYLFPVTDVKGGGYLPDVRQMSSYDLYAPPWATAPDTEFRGQDMNPFVSGEFVWTGWDYLGEPTVNNIPPGGRGRGRGATTSPATSPATGSGAVAATAPAPGRGRGPAVPDPRRSSYFGIIDLAGFPKDRFYIYQAHWRPDFPMAHILPHWNWPDRMGEVTPVHVYTSGDEAELFLNGKSLGRKKKGEFEYRIRWDDVKYEPGELKVVTYKAGKHWADETIKTTGPASKITLKPDHSTIRADGDDLSFVTVTIADQAGQMVPRSMNRVNFEITGPGEIVATDNGNAIDLESFQAHNKKAFNGLCLVIVRAKPGQTGTITLKAISDGLATAEVPITAK
ncbi:MAG TPA: beta-galactosidase GalB [Tepidisphaeraceae bacterium]|nr:beta-galactosidase GalB [Tepidisphaeraceae bacterium]